MCVNIHSQRATGWPVTQGGMVFYRVAGERLAEQWILADVHGLFRQIGPAVTA